MKKLQKKLKANLEIVELRDYEDGTIKDEFTKEEYEKVRKQCDAANRANFMEIKTTYGNENGQRINRCIKKMRVQSVEYEIIKKIWWKGFDIICYKKSSCDGTKLDEMIENNINEYSKADNFENKKLEEIQKRCSGHNNKSLWRSSYKRNWKYSNIYKKDGAWNPNSNFNNITEKIYIAE